MNLLYSLIAALILASFAFMWQGQEMRALFAMTNAVFGMQAAAWARTYKVEKDNGV